MNYKVHLCGTVDDGVNDGFSMGFNTTVVNGGTVLEVASVIQKAIDTIVAQATNDISQN